MSKQHIKDFIFSLIIFTIILSCFTLIATKDFFDRALYFDRQSFSFTFFDTTISPDRNFLMLLFRLRSFYSAFLGDFFILTLTKITNFFICYIYDCLLFLYRIIYVITGAL